MDEIVQFFSSTWISLVSVIRTFSIADAIDIVLVSYLVYKGIRLIRETRAEQLIKGLLILGVSYFIATFVGLKMLSFVLTNIFTFGVLAIIVVFQPELRRALEKVGRTKITELGGFGTDLRSGYTWSAAIPAVVEACERLSASKTGALIVIENKSKLGDLLPAGVVIDAKVSSQLLCNIFYPNTPMHDGAVIMRDGRMLAAGCFLPSTQKGEYLDKQLGARHRAAIGLSETSDAIIIVVSEETGMISIAENAKLERGFNSFTLTQYLQDRLVPKTSEKDKKNGLFGRFKRK